MKVLRNKSNVDGQKGVNDPGVAYAIGELLYFVGGELIPAVAASTELDGLSMDKITSDDDRYTTAGEIDYDRLKECDEIIMDISADAALSTALQGTAYDLKTSTSVNLAATTIGVVTFLRAQGDRGVFAVTKRTRATSA